MKVAEYGKEHCETIVLLHGGGLSWWNYQTAAERLGEKYHVVLPVLDGHAGSDRVFTTIEDNAAAVIDYIDQQWGGRIALLGGVSLGGQIVTEILSRRRDICRAAVIESASVIPMPLAKRMVKPVLNMSHGLIQKPWFAKWQFRALGINSRWYEDYYRDTCVISKESMTAFLRANAAYEVREELRGTEAKVLVLVGEKEPKQMRRSARKLCELLPGSGLEILLGLGHGQYAINYGEIFAERVDALLQHI